MTVTVDTAQRQGILMARYSYSDRLPIDGEMTVLALIEVMDKFNEYGNCSANLRDQELAIHIEWNENDDLWDIHETLDDIETGVQSSGVHFVADKSKLVVTE